MTLGYGYYLKSSNKSRNEINVYLKGNKSLNINEQESQENSIISDVFQEENSQLTVKVEEEVTEDNNVKSE